MRRASIWTSSAARRLGEIAGALAFCLAATGAARAAVPNDPILVRWFATGSTGDTGTIVIDDVEPYATAQPTGDDPANPTLPLPKVNQVGYLPDADKVCTIVAAGAATPSAPFEVRPAGGGPPVFAGQLEAAAVDETQAAGETVLRGDFSALRATGNYVVVVGDQTSLPFSIGTQIYAPLYRDAARAFYLIRSGVAIDDPETGIHHAASHTGPVRLRDRPGEQRDMSGGWYNAGDFGAWTHMAAISASYMMWLHELHGAAVGRVPLGIPESGDGTPDLLDQARWGLAWLFKMQSEDGSVYHKVDTEPDFAWGLKPEDDPYQRSAAGTSSIDAADFVAVMHQAARVFASLDAAFAQRCRDAADRAWTWLRASPDITEPDPYYTDTETWQERLWALAERARATEDAALAGELATEMAARPLEVPSWMTPQALGYLSIARAPELTRALRDTARTAIVDLADQLLAKAAANGYGVALGATEYGWGSIENVLHRANVMIFADALSADAAGGSAPPSRYRRGALGQLDYVLGRNSLNRSFVTTYGDNSVKNPYHWTKMALGQLLPGWASGGPNPSPDGADAPLQAVQQMGTPPAKCYLDLCASDGSWASNEGQTSENAALLFAAGYLSSAATDATAGGDGCGCAVGDRGAPAEGGVALALALPLLALASLAARRSQREG